MTEKRKDEGSAKRAGQEPPLAEWIIGVVGLILVAGTIGFLIFKAVNKDERPPDIVINVESVAQVENGYVVSFRAINHGGATAASVVIEGELRDEAGDTESSETTIDYIPSRSEVSGGLFFTRNPAPDRLQIRAKGYETP
jgi:uncharacterized protein (TIGR02588 family)